MIYLIPSAFSTGNSFTAEEKYENCVNTFHIYVPTEPTLYIEVTLRHDFSLKK